MASSDAQPTWGFDAGPGTVLMDVWRVRHPLSPTEGRVCYPLLEALLVDPYFSQKPPKSVPTGWFSPAWLDAKLGPFTGLSAADVHTTLCELTARCVRSALALYAADATRIQVSGEGAANARLIQRLRLLLPNAQVVTETNAII